MIRFHLIGNRRLWKCLRLFALNMFVPNYDKDRPSAGYGIGINITEGNLRLTNPLWLSVLNRSHEYVQIELQQMLRIPYLVCWPYK